VVFLVVLARVFWAPFPGSALRIGAYRGRWTSWTVDGGTHSQTRALSCGLHSGQVNRNRPRTSRAAEAQHVTGHDEIVLI
jgi:hypothetical protein